MFCMIAPSSNFVGSEFFELPHARLIEYFERTLSNSAWNPVRSLVATLKIDGENIKNRLGLYQTLKANYLKKLLAAKSKVGRKNNSGQSAVFDENGLWQRIQEQEQRALAQFFELENIELSTLARIYYGIVERIAQRLSVIPEKLVLL